MIPLRNFQSGLGPDYIHRLIVIKAKGLQPVLFKASPEMHADFKRFSNKTASYLNLFHLLM
jgi:hypothetical protein